MSNPATNAADLRWWKRNKGAVHEAIGPILARLKSQQAWRRQAYEYWARQYAGPQVSNFTALSAGSPTASTFKANPLAFNVIASVCNTVQAKIAKNRPLPKFITNGGDWSQQRKAKMLSKFVEGEFDRCGVWSLDPLMVLHACVFGEGVLKVYRDDERIHVEPEFPWRVFVDEQEAQYGMRSVRSCYQRKPVDRLVLAEMFPEHSTFILKEASNRAEDEDWGSLTDAVADQLVVTECWHLRSGKNAKDGRHAIIIEGRTLEVSDWPYDYFPFVWLRRNEPIIGVHAQGFAEALTGIQREINFVARRIQEAHYRMGGSHWAVENSSKVVAQSLNNGQANILRFTGTPPVPNHVPPFHPQTYDYLQSLIPKAFEMVGVSLMSAQARKPAGLNSGVALQEFNDTESEGFAVFAKMFEQAHVDVTKIMVDLLRELVAINPDYAVQIRGKRFLKKIQFAHVDLDPEEYIVECMPANMLGHTIAGRLDKIQALIAGGLISDPKEARRLLAFPDLERSNDLADSSHETVEEILDRMLDEGFYQSPEPHMDLIDALYTAQQTYLQARTDGAPEEVLDLVREFMLSTKDMLDRQAAANAPPAELGAPGVDPALVTPPPTDLVAAA